MNANSTGRSQIAMSRTTRVIGVAALSTILVAGLAGCMTGRVASEPPVAVRNAVAPAGIDLSQSADRIAAQLAQQAETSRANGIRFAGRPADRVAEALEREALGVQVAVVEQVAPTNPYPGWSADRIEHALQAR
ncbi:MAG: hypothetical protein ABWZ16_05570 [Microbacterium sp.]